MERITTTKKPLTPSHRYLWLELLLLYVVLPLFIWNFIEYIRQIRGGGSFLIFFLPVTAVILTTLLFKKNLLTKSALLHREKGWYHLKRIRLFFLPFAVFTSVAVYLWKPAQLFIIPRQKPWLWLLILVFYPIFSVVSQGIIYRVYFFTRYQTILTNPSKLIFVSAACFSFGHIIFGNYIAPLLTFFGGLIFAWRYYHTQSWLISSVEHAVYGCWLFTVGLGQFLYSGG